MYCNYAQYSKNYPQYFECKELLQLDFITPNDNKDTPLILNDLKSGVYYCDSFGYIGFNVGTRTTNLRVYKGQMLTIWNTSNTTPQNPIIFSTITIDNGLQILTFKSDFSQTLFSGKLDYNFINKVADIEHQVKSNTDMIDELDIRVSDLGG